MSTSVLTRPAPGAAATPYRRPTWQEAVAEYLPPRMRRKEWIDRLPLAVILIVFALLAVRLRNTVMIDEALYINAGQDYILHWRNNGPEPGHGADFSGVPFLYPVLAACIDAIGGLALVRLTSLAFMLVGVVAVYATTRHIFASERAGLLAAGSLALTGPVIYLGHMATFDAAVFMVLALAAYCGVTGRSWQSALVMGGLLSLAVMLKYTGAVYVPVVLGLTFLLGRHGIVRAAIGWFSAASVLLAAWMRWGSTLEAGLAFTTTERTALAPAPSSDLTALLLLDIGVIGLFALIGAALWGRDWRRQLVVIGLLLGAAALPIAHLRLGEAVSFDKHMAYAALWLAPLAGYGLARMSRGMFRLGAILPLLLVALLFGFSRSDTMFQGWVSVEPVLDVIDSNPEPGLYLSSATDSLKYYTRDEHPQIGWETSFALYAGGESSVVRAVSERRYQTVILRSASTGNPEQDALQAVLVDALEGSDDYELAVDPIPAQQYSDDRWFIYTKS